MEVKASAPTTRIVDALTGEIASPVLGILSTAEQIHGGLAERDRLARDNAMLRSQAEGLAEAYELLTEENAGLLCRIGELEGERESLKGRLIAARDDVRSLLDQLDHVAFWGIGGTAMTGERYWHGGAPGLKAGDIIEPRAANDTRHLVDGCPTCEARRRGEQLEADDNDPGLVYITTDRDYARFYAAGYPHGSLYHVEPLGDLVDRSEHDPVPSWGCEAVRVLSVYDPLVILTEKRVRSLTRRWAT